MESWVVEVLRKGYRVPFHSCLLLSNSPVHLPNYSPPSIRGWIFVAPKAGGSWRPIIDLSGLNKFVTSTKFLMETSQSVLRSVRREEWMIAVGLKDAYLQFPIHQESWKFLRFSGPTGTFQFKVLCFGLTTAPQVFTRVISPVSDIMHCRGFRMRRYLDNWLVQASSKGKALQARDFLLNLCQKLGIRINFDKSSLFPTQVKTYLGMTIQMRLLRAFPTEEQVLAILSQLETFMSNKVQPVTLWKSLLGQMASLSLLVPGSRLRMHSLQVCLRNRWDCREENASVIWDDSCLKNLQWWSEEHHLTTGTRLDSPRFQMYICTQMPQTRFVSGKLNVLVDALSRSQEVLEGEWKLVQDEVQLLLKRWPATVDLFATRMNHSIPVYSPVADPMSCRTEAMLHSWDNLQVYGFPPFGMIQEVLAKLRSCRNTQMTLVYPFWPQRPWFPDLLDLLTEVPVFIPERRDSLKQPHFHNFHRNLRVLKLAVWRLPSERPVIRDSLKQWLDNCLSA
ncbi:uncharacterized protein [Macrobrachium rosenbergii]|uniref:uncharacterized protein n=1 Tax=Macrobrachium rosenbergii TaxID=79674 RepID=UPI0034D5C7C8